MKHIVKKLGGENAAQIYNSARNIIQDAQEGVSQSVVISAMRSAEFNTTDQLIALGEKIKKYRSLSDGGEKSALFTSIFNAIEFIKGFHLGLVSAEMSSVLGGDMAVLIDLINERFAELESCVLEYCKNGKYEEFKPDYVFTAQDARGEVKTLSLLGFGEDISASIFSASIELLSAKMDTRVKSEVIKTRSLIGKVLSSASGAFDHLTSNIGKRVSDIIGTGAVAVVPGYIPGFPGGIEKVVGRGYTDATAAALAVGMKGEGYDDTELHIQKSVRGLLSIDPKIAEEDVTPQLLELVNYTTAREITGGAQAKLLHAQTLRKEVLAAGISVRLYDPFDTTSEGTTISKRGTDKKGVQFIGHKEILQFSVSSTKMGGPGILATIFHIVKDYASVDIVACTETEVSFTIDKNGPGTSYEDLIHKIKQALDILDDDEHEFIKVSDKSLVFCIGQNISNLIGTLARATGALSKANINVELASQGALQRAMVLSVERTDVLRAVNALHRELIEGGS